MALHVDPSYSSDAVFTFAVDSKLNCFPSLLSHVRTVVDTL